MIELDPDAELLPRIARGDKLVSHLFIKQF